MIQQQLDIYKVVIIGDSATGKTNIARRIIQTNFLQTEKPTVSVQFFTKYINLQNSKIKVTIWDTAGQQRYRHLNKLYYKNALGIILVYDITDSRSYQNLQIWLNSVNENLDPNEYKLIIIGNKSDLAAHRKIPFQTVTHWYKHKLGYQCFQTSAKTNDGILESINFLIKNIYQMVHADHLDFSLQSYRQSDIDIIQTPNNKSKQERISTLKSLKSLKYVSKISKRQRSGVQAFKIHEQKKYVSIKQDKKENDRTKSEVIKDEGKKSQCC